MGMSPSTAFFPTESRVLADTHSARPAFGPGLFPSGFYEALSVLRSQGWLSPLARWTHSPLCWKLFSSLPNVPHSVLLWLIHDIHQAKDYTHHLLWNAFFYSLSPKGRDKLPELCLKGEETCFYAPFAQSFPAKASPQLTAFYCSPACLEAGCDCPAHTCVPGV